MAEELPSAADVRAPSSSLNGFWERGRRLLRLMGSEWDSRAQSVVIIGDSREPCGLPQSYRRFMLTYSGAGHAVGTCYKIRCDALDGVVITDLAFAHANVAAHPSLVLRTLTAAQVVADGAAYIPITNAIATCAAAWVDNPAEGFPPFSGSTGGAVGAGNPFYSVNGLTERFNFSNVGIFLPFGAAINLYYTQATTVESFNIAGYLK